MRIMRFWRIKTAKTNILALFVTLFVVSIAQSQSVAAFSGGTGTSGDPYEISTPAHLASMSSYLGSGNTNTYFELVNNIDLNVSPYNTGSGWTPIGPSSSSSSFYGKFDGNGYTISNLYINRSISYVGLFGYTTSAVIQDVNFTNANVINTGQRTGIAVGNPSTSTLTNISVAGTVSTTGTYTGGLAGYAYQSSITDSDSSATVTSTNSYVGGLVAHAEGSSLSNSTITNSYSTGNVRGAGYVGGFIGSRYHGTISQSYATGDVLGDGTGGTTNSYSGGFVGIHCQGLINSSFATGDVYGDTDIGGFAGQSHNCSGSITNAYARGNVYPSTAGTGGSFMRYIYLGTVANSYSTGSVDGQTNGGFIYYDHTCSSCINNFWDTQTSGQSTGGIFSGGRATGKTTAQMKSVATFTTTGTAGLTSPWDFVGNPNNDTANNDYWNIDSGMNDGYPYLNWYVPANQLPAVASLGATSKVNGSWGNDNTPSVTFTTSDSDNSDTVQYRIQIDDTSDFSSPVTDYTSALASPGASTFTVGQGAGSGTYTTGSAGQTLSNGQYYWRVKAIDNNAAESAYSTANSGSIAFGIDIIEPLSPDNPTLASDNNDNTPNLTLVGSTDAGGSGLANPAYLVEWSLDSSFSSGVFSGTTNTTSYTISTPLADGQWYTRATATDNAGNSTLSDNGSFVIDTVAPTLQTLSPANGATNVSINPTLSMKFNQTAGAVTGNILIRKVSDNSIVETIPVGGGPVSGSGTDTITIDPFNALEYSTTYYVEVASTAIDDLYRNYYAGISGSSTWVFTTESQPASPSSGGSGNSNSSASTNTTSSTNSNAAPRTVARSSPSDADSEPQTLPPILLNDYSEFTDQDGKQLTAQNGQILKFNHEDEQHTITVKEVGLDFVTVVIASTPKTFTLYVNDTITHDVDGDGNDDISVSLLDITDGVANLSFKQLAASQQDSSSSPTTNTTTTSSEKATNWWPYIIAILVVTVIISAAVHYSRKVKK